MDEQQKEIKNDIPDSNKNIQEPAQSGAQADAAGGKQEDRPLTYGDDSKVYADGGTQFTHQSPDMQQNQYAGGQNPYAGQELHRGPGPQNQFQGFSSNPQNPYAGQQSSYTQPGQQDPVQGQYAGQSQYTGPQNQYTGQGQYTDQQAQFNPQQNQYKAPQGQYAQPVSGYGQPFYGYGNQQPAHGPVKDIFCYFVLVLLPLRNILGFFSVNMMFDHMTYHSMMSRGYMVRVLEGPYQLLSLLSTALMIAYVIFVAFDISQIYKQNYKITGLILFAIFLTPGYYIWRAYILGRKKTVPIIYTIFISLMLFVYFAFIMYTVFSMVFETMVYM